MVHFRVNRLNTLPKISVIDVHLGMMTLYGIEKSGVGRSTRSVGVYIRFGMFRPYNDNNDSDTYRDWEADGGG